MWNTTGPFICVMQNSEDDYNGADFLDSLADTGIRPLQLRASVLSVALRRGVALPCSECQSWWQNTSAHCPRQWSASKQQLVVSAFVSALRSSDLTLPISSNSTALQGNPLVFSAGYQLFSQSESAVAWARGNLSGWGGQLLKWCTLFCLCS